MQTYELLVKNRAVKPNSKDMTLVRTSIGIDQVHIMFDDAEWLDFPIRITFAQGDDVVTQSLVVSEIPESDEWVAEATVTVPYEVIDMVGKIRVTLQGTDEEGRHIITAKGSPLSVEEAGDVVDGAPPADAPTTDEWHQAYSQAMEAVNAAAGLVATLRSELDDMIERVRAEVADEVADAILPATNERIGSVIVGDGLDVTAEGRLSVTSLEGLTQEQKAQLANLASLAYYCFDTEFDDRGRVKSTATVKQTAMPLAKISSVGAVKVDDETIKVSTDGTISSPQYELPVASSEELGGVMPDGVTLLNEDGLVSVPTATAGSLGLVRPDGTTITIEDGVITASGSGEGGYILPRASTSQLGGVMVDGVTIGIVDGVISVLLKDAAEEVY